MLLMLITIIWAPFDYVEWQCILFYGTISTFLFPELVEGLSIFLLLA